MRAQCRPGHGSQAECSPLVTAPRLGRSMAARITSQPSSSEWRSRRRQRLARASAAKCAASARPLPAARCPLPVAGARGRGVGMHAHCRSGPGQPRTTEPSMRALPERPCACSLRMGRAEPLSARRHAVAGVPSPLRASLPSRPTDLHISRDPALASRRPAPRTAHHAPRIHAPRPCPSFVAPLTPLLFARASVGMLPPALPPPPPPPFIAVDASALGSRRRPPTCTPLHGGACLFPTPDSASLAHGLFSRLEPRGRPPSVSGRARGPRAARAAEAPAPHRIGGRFGPTNQLILDAQ